MKPLKIAALQSILHWHDPEVNKSHIAQFLDNQQVDTDILILPEMFTTGFSMEAPALAEAEEGKSLEWMQTIALKYDCLLVGSIIIHENGAYFNRLLAVDKNGILARYNKRHLFRMANEHIVYQAGIEKVIFEYKGWRICPQICYDLRFPVWSRNPVSEDGYAYDLLIYVANWPAMRAKHWVNLLTSRAIENQSYVVGVNRVGKDGNDLPYSGNSAIIDYMGEKMAYLEDKEGLLNATITYENMNKWRNKFPIWKDADSFSIDHSNSMVI